MCNECPRFIQYPTPDGATACYKCYPYGAACDETWVRSQIMSMRGDKGLKKSVSSNKIDPVSYYVWRMARFHGGADVTMPMVAMFTRGSVTKEQNAWADNMADQIAIETFGSKFKAAERWSRVFGYGG